MNNFATILACAAIASTANAFWGTGHLLVSRNAQAILESSGSNALQAALDDLSYLKKSQASLTKDEQDHPFTECANFADNIKGQGYSFQSQWHFINQPYFADGGDVSDYPEFEMPDVDVVQALTDLTAFLKDEDVSSSTYVSQIQDSFEDEKDQRSFALRLIIHYAGDIHQPLHAVAEVDNEYPKGDKGGNSEWIPNIDGVGNLHSVWDSVIYEYTGYPNLPFDSDDWDWYTSEAKKLSQEYPIAISKLHSKDFSEWAQESLTLSQDAVYPGFTEHEAVSDEYKEKAQLVIQERLMYGGARLADLIEDIYSSSRLRTITEFTDMVATFLN